MQSRLLTIREQWLLLGVGLAILLGAGVLVWRGAPGTRTPEGRFPIVGDGAAGTPVPPSPPPQPSTIETREPAARIGVGVIGAVRKPGVYYFDAGARVQDLLQAAGDVLPESDLSNINRTAFLIDETTLLVPRLVSKGNFTYSDPADPHNPPAYTRSAWYRPELSTTAAANSGAEARHAPYQSSATAATGRININTATQNELESLPGIGPVTAQKIIAHRRQRPFNRPEDLEEVSGIGPAKMAAVRDHITVR